MKREQALKIIDKVYKEFVEEWASTNINDLDKIKPLNERVLSALEEAGMVPPLRYLEAFGTYDNGWEEDGEET